MRPKLLEIEGLQSFQETQTIDFAALGETGLFGIFGPTGSGKSTILDAVTFALYGDVKRAKNGTQGIINSNRKTVRVSFTFELSRDGTRKNYRVERTYQRRKGSENACEAKVARLIEITVSGEIPLCDKANDVTGKVQELIGLNQTDFTRAVVLPQNSFQEFLLLGNSERRGMLERIFYLEEYGKELWEKLNRKMSSLGDRILNLSGQLKGFEDASDEALEAAKKAMEGAVADREAVQKKFRATEDSYKEAEEVWELVQELDLVNGRELAHVRLKDEISAKRSVLERAARADGILELVKNCKDLNRKLAETIHDLRTVDNGLPPERAGLEKAQAEFRELNEEMKSNQPRLVERRARLQDALSLEAEVAGLTARIEETGKEIDRLNASLSAKTELLSKEETEYAALTLELQKLGAEADSVRIPPEYRVEIQTGSRLEIENEAQAQNVKDLEMKAQVLKSSVVISENEIAKVGSEIQEAQKHLDGVNEQKINHDGQLPGDRKDLQNRIDRLHSLEAVYQVISVRKAELDGLEGKLGKIESDWMHLTEKSRFLEEENKKSSLFYEEQKAEFEAANRELDGSAAHRLARDLKEGEPCPVCGSMHHPNPASFEADTDVSVLERRVKDIAENQSGAEKRLREAEKACLMANGQLRTLSEQRAQINQEYEQKSGQYASERAKLPETLRNLELDALRTRLDGMNQAGMEKLRALEAWENENEKLKEALPAVNERLAKLRITENGLAAGLKIQKENLDNMTKALSESARLFDESNARHAAFLNRFGLNSVSSELARLSEADVRLNVLQRAITQKNEKLEQQKVIIENHRTDLQNARAEKVGVETEQKNLTARKDAVVARVREIAGDSDIIDGIQSIEVKLAGYSEREKLLQSTLLEFEEKVRQLESRRALLDNQKRIFDESVSKEEARLRAALAEKGFSSAEEAEASIIPGDAQKAIKREIEIFDQESVNIHAHQSLLNNKLGTRRLSGEEWAAMSDAYREIAAHKEDSVSKSEVALSRFKDVGAKHEKWTGISRELQELNHRQGLLEQIRKLLGAGKGSFIDYIAEERIRYVAARASETLGTMTRFKYALELDAENGFIIRDNANGGVRRPVTSLSGGETFLTSLSLALALSEQIQLKGQSPLEFFFLDEGFGTLDSSLLDNVMDSLERLSSTERVIGLISHVPELRSRLSRRLVVDPPTSGGEGTRVHIEKG